MSEDVKVKVNQVWADCDRRRAGRTVRVIGVCGDKALVQASGDFGRSYSHRTTEIRLDRFRPGSTGYRLVPDDEAPAGL